MSQRQVIESRLALYEELSGILGAMRGYAIAEQQRVARREAAERQVISALARALSAVGPWLPLDPPDGDAWLLIGSSRGFCGSFNQEVVATWQAEGGAGLPPLVVGERLQAAMPVDVGFTPIEGASNSLEAARVIDRILAALAALGRSGSQGLLVCFHADHEVRVRRLLPPHLHPQQAARLAPLSNEPLDQVATGVAEHFLYHGLLAALLQSIRIENRRRLMQMENALSHLENRSDDLLHQRNRIRQEEIVEEIEILGGAAQGHFGL